MELSPMQRAIELVRRGTSYRQAARICGIAPRTIRDWCISVGVRSRYLAEYPEEIRKKAIELVKNGMPYYRVAKTLGIPCPTIRNWCLKAGIKSQWKSEHLKKYVKEEVLDGIRYLVSEDYVRLRQLWKRIHELERKLRNMRREEKMERELERLKAEAEKLEEQLRRNPTQFIKVISLKPIPQEGMGREK